MSDTPERIGSFRILGVMGRGGMGIVYRGVHESTGVEAAIKTVRTAHGDFVQSLRREIHALSRMEHPGVVRVLDSGFELGMPWYAMELLDGVTLRERLRRRDAGAVQESTSHLLPSIRTESVPSPEDREHSGDGTDWWTLRVNKGTAESAATPRVAAGTPINADSVEAAESALAVGETHRPLAAGGRLGEALTLVRRLCETLAFLHGEGVVHRDLKPENILLVSDRPAKDRARTTVSAKRSDGVAKSRVRAVRSEVERSVSGLDGSSFGRPVLVDFGLASRWPLAMVGQSGAEQDRIGRESLDAAVQAAGTLAYMAPEQLRGELVDARADLYALGCILYELITGSRPFLAKSESGLVRAHLQTEPAAPSLLVDGVDPALDELTLGLLSKDPRQRIGHADAVANALELLGADAKPIAGTPKHRAYLYRPSFAGRAEPLSSLMHWTGMGNAGRGTLICIGGESGVGKTRLALELGRRLGAWGATVLVGASPADGGGAERQAQPLGALRAPLQMLADRFGASPVETSRVFGGRIRILAAYAPALLQLPGAADEPELATLPAEAARLRLFEAVSETFAAATQGGQTILLLDDLQNADELSLSWLEAFLRSGRLERLPLSIVCTYRSDAVREDLSRLMARPEVRQLPLGRIEAEAVGSIVADMLALYPPPEGFVEFLVRESEGNPFFVAEYLRTAVEMRLLDRDQRGRWCVPERLDGAVSWEQLPLPKSLRQLVLQHLEALSPQARRLAEVAAVLGREVDPAWLQSVSDANVAEMLEASQELVLHQVLEQSDAGRLRFAHDKLREIAYECLPARERRRLHRRAAEALEQTQPEVQVETEARLGFHWQKAGAPARARTHYLAAARQAVARYALGEGEQLYRAYLALVRKPSVESASVRNELGYDVLLRRGRHADAQREHEAAIVEARQLHDQRTEGVGLYRQAAVLLRTGSALRAKEVCLEAIERLRGIEAMEPLGEALVHLGSVEMQLGQVGAARSNFEEALELNRRTGSALWEGTSIEFLGVAAWNQGLVEEAWNLWQQAIELHQRSGNRINEGSALRNLAALANLQGRPEESYELLGRAMEIFRTIGALREEGVALTNYGHTAWKLQRPEEAEVFLRRALALQQSIGDHRYQGLSLNNLAAVHADRGELNRARELYDQALALSREIGDRPLEALCLRDRAALERRLGTDLNFAETLLDESESIFNAMTNHLECARCQCERGHSRLARERDPSEVLLAIRTRIDRLPGAPPHDLESAIARLQAAVAARESKEPLYRGERLQDLPATFRRWLVGQAQI